MGLMPGELHKPTSIMASPGRELQQKLLLVQVRNARGNLIGSLKQDEQDVANDVMALVQTAVPLSLKCQALLVEGIVQDNCKNPGDLDLLCQTLLILQKFGSNLLKAAPSRPPLWRTVRHALLQEKIDGIKGARRILKSLGYTDSSPEGMTFPLNQEPDLEVVAMVTADLFILHKELEMYIQGCHPCPSIIDQLLPVSCRCRQTQARFGSGQQTTMSDNNHSAEASKKPSPYVLPRPTAVVRKVSSNPVPPTTPRQHPELKQTTSATQHLMPRHGMNTAANQSPAGTAAAAATVAASDGPDVSANPWATWQHLLRGGSGNGKVPGSGSPLTQPKKGGHPTEPRDVEPQHAPEPSSSRAVRPGIQAAHNEAVNQTEAVPCDICGRTMPEWLCLQCDGKQLCTDCDGMWHCHAKRRHHTRQPMPGVKVKPEASTTQEAQDHPESVVVIKGRRWGSPQRAINNGSEQLSDNQGDLGQQSSKAELPNLSIFNSSVGGASTSPSRSFSVTHNGARAPPGGGSLNQVLPVMVEQAQLYSRDDQGLASLMTALKSECDLGHGKGQMATLMNRFEIDLEVVNERLKDVVLDDRNYRSICADREKLVQRFLREIEMERRIASESVKPPPASYVPPIDKPTGSHEYVDLLEEEDEYLMPRKTPLSGKESNNDSPYIDMSGQHKKSHPQSPSGANVETEGQWKCEHCTLINRDSIRICEVCSHTRTVTSRRQEAKEAETSSSPGGGGVVRRERSVSGSSLDSYRSRVVELQEEAEQVLQEKKRAQMEDRMRMEAETRQPTTTVAVRPAAAVTPAAAPTDRSPLVPRSRTQSATEKKPIEKGRNLRADMYDRVQQVVTLATSGLRAEHPLAAVSQDEAHVCLLAENGDVKAAALRCADAWRLRWQEIVSNVESLVSNRTQSAAVLQQVLSCCQGNLNRLTLQVVQEPGSSPDAAQEVTLEEGSREEVAALKALPLEVVECKVKDKAISREKRLRMVMSVYSVRSLTLADNVLQLIDRGDLSEDVALNDIIEAVTSCSDLSRSLSYLSQKCEICKETLPANKIQSLSFCQCRICITCLKRNFEINIRERAVTDLVCPVCRVPDLDNQQQAEPHFQLLDMMLQNLVSRDVYELFQDKLRDWNLMQDPCFRWCSYDDCRCGIIFNGQPGQLKMTCPECQRVTCFKCKKPWEAGHAGRSCEQFQAWKEPPTAPQDITGIVCPRCQFWYSLAKGGCLHFTCAQCQSEFCSGCSRPFTRQGCQQVRQCARNDLHCHHPRDCLYFLRDWSVRRLQQLLENDNTGYDTSPPGGRMVHRCPQMEQKESGEDAPCGLDVHVGQAGLCELHYKEYLVSVINSQTIDPVDEMDVEELRALLLREGHPMSELSNIQPLSVYKEKLRQISKQRYPLPLRRAQSVISL